ncbi:MAG: DUF2520 domain-containing protein [Deltaproteobacteria bacterium]|nr:DUF2520 domain-containing protein [Deltaproteobacteria bacterium]
MIPPRPNAVVAEGVVLVGVLGLGRAGCAFVRSLHAAGISVVASSSSAHVRREMSPLLQEPAFAQSAELVAFVAAKKNALLLIAVADDAISAVADEVAAFPEALLRVAHCCGSKAADVLAAFGEGVEIAVIHPMAALQSDAPIPQGTLVAVEASSDAFAEDLLTLATRIGGICTRRKVGEHAAYHCAAVTAGNLAVGLLQYGVELLGQAGIDEDTARKGLAHLLVTTATAAAEKPLANALTGPVARGDVRTIDAHLEVLEEHPGIDRVYRDLSLKLCDVVQDAATGLEDKKKGNVEELRMLLTKLKIR